MLAFTAEEMAAIDAAILTERILDRQAQVYQVMADLIAARASTAAEFLSRFERRNDPEQRYASIVECKDCAADMGIVGTDVAALYRAAIGHAAQCPARLEQAIDQWILFDDQLANEATHAGGDRSAYSGAQDSRTHTGVVASVAARLWVNGTRPAPPHWTWARTAQEAVAALQANDVEEMSLDHDVAGDATARAVILWLTENPGQWPPEILLHGSEPKRAGWLLDAIARHRPTTW